MSENINGSSSSIVSLWSDQPMEPLSSFELPPLDFASELGSSGISRYKCFNMKRAVSWSLQQFLYTKIHKLKEDQGTKAAQHAGSSYLFVIIFPTTKNGDKREENY